VKKGTNRSYRFETDIFIKYQISVDIIVGEPKLLSELPASVNALYFKALIIEPIRGCPLKTSAVREERGLPSADILRTRREGVLQMRTSALFGAKTSDFFQNLWCVRTDKWRGG